MNQTEIFLRTLYEPYAAYPSAHMELRAFPPPEHKRDPKYPRPPRKWFPLTPPALSECAEQVPAWGEDFECYMGVLPRIRGGGGAEHLRLCSWLWADIDGGDGGLDDACALYLAGQNQKGLPRPHMVVVSGGGLHSYWKLSEPVSVRTEEEQIRLRNALRRLVQYIGGEAPGAHADRASTDPARILRLPGTWNHKLPDEMRGVYLRIYAPHEEAHSLAWWEARLPALPLPAPRKPAPQRRTDYTPSDLYPATIEKMAHGAPRGAIHNTAVKVAVAALKQGLDPAVVRSYTEQVAAVSGVDISDPREQQHFADIVDWAERNIAASPS